MSCVYRGPVYPNVEEGIRLFTLRYEQVVSESLPLLRALDSVTVKTGHKELTAWCVAAGYTGGVRYYLGMDGVVYVLGGAQHGWVAATPEACAQLVRMAAWLHAGDLCVSRFLSRFEEVLDTTLALARSLAHLVEVQDLATLKQSEHFQI